MSVVVLVLLVATIAAAAALSVAMYVKDMPIYGGIAVCALVGPGLVLTFLYLALA